MEKCPNIISQINAYYQFTRKSIEILNEKPPVIPVSSVPVFKFENSLVEASRVPTPVTPV
jgi:hypothetical protein